MVVSDTGLFGAHEPLSIRRAKEPKLAVKREAYGKSSSFLKTMCTGSFYRSQVRRQCVQIQADNFYLKREPNLRFEVEAILSGNWNSFLRTVRKSAKQLQDNEASEIHRKPLYFCWSGRLDSNQRPLAPQANALPDCATSRNHRFFRLDFSRRFVKPVVSARGLRILVSELCSGSRAVRATAMQANAMHPDAPD